MVLSIIAENNIPKYDKTIYFFKFNKEITSNKKREP
jgi:hypothetical protein